VAIKFVWKVTAIHLNAGILLSLFHVRFGDVAEIGDVTQVEAHCLSHKQIERHLVDRLARGIDVPERIDMSANVIERGDKICLEGHGVAGHAKVKSFRGLMTQMRGDHRPLEELMRRHVVLDQQASR
jgi:hypothetical protein